MDAADGHAGRRVGHGIVVHPDDCQLVWHPDAMETSGFDQKTGDHIVDGEDPARLWQLVDENETPQVMEQLARGTRQAMKMVIRPQQGTVGAAA